MTLLLLAIIFISICIFGALPVPSSIAKAINYLLWIYPPRSVSIRIAPRPSRLKKRPRFTLPTAFTEITT